MDGMIVWISMRMVTKATLSRGEFGIRVGMPRILDLLDKYGIKATFFTPGHTAHTHPGIIAEAHKRGNEVAAHSMYHLPQEANDKTPLEEKRRYLKMQVEAIERATGEKPLGFRSSGDFLSDDMPNLLMEMGFVYDSSLMGDDFSPYKMRLGDKVLREEPYTIEFGQECPLLEFPWHWDQDDFPHFEFFSFYLNPRNPFYAATPLSSYKKVKEVWVGSFDWMYENVPGGLHHSVLHPQVSGRGQRIKFLEEVMQYITAKPDVWVAPLIDLARVWQD